MRKSSEHPKRRLGWMVAALSVAVALAGAGFARETLRARQIDREIRALQAEAESLRVRNFEITSLQASLESGEFLEREARTKLGLQKEGEHVVVLRKETSAAPTGVQEALTEQRKEETWSNPRRWWTAFADPRAFEDYARSRNARTAPTGPAALR